MKTFYFLFVVTISSFVLSQELKFEEVVHTDSAFTKKDLFNSGKLWLNDTYKSGKAVIQMEDVEVGVILGKATIKYEPGFFMSSGPARGYINYTIKLSFKDGRYKYEFYDFIHEGSTNQYGQNGTLGLLNDGETYNGNSKVFNKAYRNKLNKDALEKIKYLIPILIEDLKEYMSNPKNTFNNESDW